MSVPRLLRPLLILAISAACSSNGIPGPATELHAVAARTCGPADGPAVEIYLSRAPIESLEPPAPYHRVAVWQPLDHLAGRSWSLAPDDGEGGAWSHPTATELEIATGGTATVTAVRPDSTVEGSVDVTFPSGTRLRGTFRAPWHPRQMLCG